MLCTACLVKRLQTQFCVNLMYRGLGRPLCISRSVPLFPHPPTECIEKMQGDSETQECKNVPPSSTSFSRATLTSGQGTALKQMLTTNDAVAATLPDRNVGNPELRSPSPPARMEQNHSTYNSSVPVSDSTAENPSGSW